jgi:cell division protein FtsZ
MNTDAQHLSTTLTDQRLQLGVELTGGLGCGADPEMGRLAAEECRLDIEAELQGANMIFLAAGMGGGTGTGATPVVAEIAYNLGILTVAVVTLPFLSEGIYRHDSAAQGIQRLRDVVDTLIVVPNQNLLALATEETSIIEAYSMADDVMLGGVQSISNLITKPGLVNTDFADFQAVMYGMGNALLGTGVVPVGQGRGLEAANMALENPLLGSNLDISSAKGLIVNVSGGSDLNLLESDAIICHIKNRLKESNAKIISGWTYDESLRGFIRVSVVATGIDHIEDAQQ